jgi:DNA polymerase-3 subunit delta
MMVKYSALIQHMRTKQYLIYILTGLDLYLSNEAALHIKKSCRESYDLDEKNHDITTAADWQNLFEEANHYSLFSECIFLQVHFDKKSLDAMAKKALAAYLTKPNSRSIILLRAPHLNSKALQSIAQNPHVLWIQVDPLSPIAFKKWITGKLNDRGIQYSTDVPDLIYQHTQHNLLAAAQIIETVHLAYQPGEILSAEILGPHLNDHCDYALYELSDACLRADAEKAIHVLRALRQDRGEPSLVLWLLTQDIRLLIQLEHALREKTPLLTACNQLKIWPKRAVLYEETLKRLPTNTLYQLLDQGQKLDMSIKSNQNSLVWFGLEQLALGLSGLHEVRS